MTSASASAGGSTSRWRPRPRRRRPQGPHDLACQREQRAELARELEGLSNDQRHVMVMKDVLALSYEEIADVLEMPVGTVKCHAHRGRARMRRALEPPAEAVPA